MSYEGYTTSRAYQAVIEMQRKQVFNKAETADTALYLALQLSFGSFPYLFIFLFFF